MSPISSQSLNRANSASRKTTKGFKKGKSSEFNPKDYEQVKSSPSLKVWSHEGSTFLKKGPHFGQNSRPGESDPYVYFTKPAFNMKSVSLQNKYDWKTKI